MSEDTGSTPASDSLWRRCVDARGTWPSLSARIELFPWRWKLIPRLYHDDVDGWIGLTEVEWLFLRLEWMGNRPLFWEPKVKVQP